MQADLKKRWVEALRSGKYPQTTEHLRDAKGYCCLGVLLNVVDAEAWYALGDVYRHSSNEHWSASLKPETQGELGLVDDIHNELIAMNDDEGKSFSEIADWIEANL